MNKRTEAIASQDFGDRPEAFDFAVGEAAVDPVAEACDFPLAEALEAVAEGEVA